ncbi:HTH domain-containing protein [Kribbella sp. VKM Ac-2571]|uniref:helix-turn-helix domain-containing protein n=1 Tax=Kribbella sp. VKM Ac-2571 TaxID=2512222 RepID=UPI00105C738F|nr:helix-turn-helix domain-containing protein [Kribbella sp. VKM Ac-2571]TDO59949.1 HTH domain-containing protein [Kribbella sp. VKM Ac-2571]
MPEQHPLVQAIAPLVERLDAQLVDAAEARADDVTLEWDGEPVVAVRLSPAKAPEKPEGGVQSLLAGVAEELGGPLRDLSRHDKQQAVLLLEARGAFEYRKSAEIVAEALGVTRFTVYNYLNRAR